MIPPDLISGHPQLPSPSPAALACSSLQNDRGKDEGVGWHSRPAGLPWRQSGDHSQRWPSSLPHGRACLGGMGCRPAGAGHKRDGGRCGRSRRAPVLVLCHGRWIVMACQLGMRSHFLCLSGFLVWPWCSRGGGLGMTPAWPSSRATVSDGCAPTDSQYLSKGKGGGGGRGH